MSATEKQIDYILALANQIEGTRSKYLSQVRGTIGVSSFKLQRGFTKAEASAIINDLKTRVAAK